MIEVEFECNQNKIMIQANINESFQAVIDKYIQKSLIQSNSVYFIANGNQIKPESSLESIMTDIDKQNKKIKVLVNMLEDKDDDSQEQVIIKSKFIICPKCGEICRITIEDCKIKLFGCCNNHTTNGIRLLDFKDSQKVNISKIVCGKCKLKNKGDSINHEFYICLTCKINLCTLCKINHNSSHNVIRDEQINNICLKHNKEFIEYCTKCNVNTCFSCEEHIEHETINLKKLKPNKDEIKNQLLQLKQEIETLVGEKQISLTKLNEFKEALNIFYEINNDIFNIYEMENQNYQILENIKLITNNEIFERLKKINKEIDSKDKMLNIIELNSKINSYDENLPKKKIENEDSKIEMEKQKIDENKKESDNQTSSDFSEDDLICKVILLGAVNSGKDQMLNNTSYMGKCMYFDDFDKEVKFEIWGTSGQKEYRHLSKIFFKDSKACILVYDITNKESFDELKNVWIDIVKKYGHKDISKKIINI